MVGPLDRRTSRIVLFARSWLKMQAPAHGDRILLLKEPWLQMLLRGEKTLEIRGCPLAAGPAWLGTRGTLYGSCVLGQPFAIGTADEWTALRSRHLVQGPPPYKHPWASPLLDVRRLTPLQPYRHPMGAIGIVRYTQG